jgi:hypothetical protein
VPALVGLFLVVGFISQSQDSANFDETPHLAAGVSYLETGDFRLNPEHPPLVKVLAAAPLVLLGRGGGDYRSRVWNGAPLSDADPRRSRAAEWEFGFRLLNGGPSAPRDPSARLTPARSVILVLGALLSLVVYAWSRALFGAPAGLLALTLAVTCPTLLAHSRLVTTDLPAALGFTATAWLAWRWVAAPSWQRAAMAGASLGAALLIKFSCALLAPLIVVLAGAAVLTGRLNLKRAIVGVLLIAAVAYAAIWAGYGFRFAASRDAGYVLEWQDLDADYPPSSPVRFAREHHLFPEAYLFGLGYAKSQSAGRVSFLDGQQSLAGWYRYFPEAFFLKTPLAFTALALWVLASGVRRTGGRSFDGWCVALPPLVYAALAVQSRFNIGHRHIAVVYPFLCIGMAPAAEWLAARSARAVAVAVLVGSCFVSFALATPRYLSYFNVAAGGPRGGAGHLVDSNIDWGQDLRRLKLWMDANGVPEIDLAYFGTGDPRAYGIKFRKVALFIDFYRELPTVRPAAGQYLAASVTLLAGVYMEGDRAFSTAILERGLVSRSLIVEYLTENEARVEHGVPLVHVADWMIARHAITDEQRRDVEAGIPAAWLEHVRKTLTPLAWAGDSIAIYRID